MLPADGNLQSPPSWIDDTNRPISSLRSSASTPWPFSVDRLDLAIARAQKKDEPEAGARLPAILVFAQIAVRADRPGDVSIPAIPISRSRRSRSPIPIDPDQYGAVC